MVDMYQHIGKICCLYVYCVPWRWSHEFSAYLPSVTVSLPRDCSLNFVKFLRWLTDCVRHFHYGLWFCLIKPKWKLLGPLSVRLVNSHL